MGSLESVAASKGPNKKGEKAIVYYGRMHVIRSANHQDYLLQMTPYKDFFKDSFYTLTSFIPSYRYIIATIYDDIALNITRHCGGSDYNIKQRNSYRTIGYAGKSTNPHSHLYAAELLRNIRNSNKNKNKTFEKCLLESIDQEVYVLHYYDQFMDILIKQIISLTFLLLAARSIASLFKMKPEDQLEETTEINAKRVKDAEISEDTIPHDFLCPITLSIMDEPVRTFDATAESKNPYFNKLPSYDLIPIRNWLKNNDYAPHAAGVKLKNKLLKPDTQLKTSIEDFIRRGEFLFHNKDQRSIELPHLSKRKIRAYSK